MIQFKEWHLTWDGAPVAMQFDSGSVPLEIRGELGLTTPLEAEFDALRAKYGNKIAPLVVPIWDEGKKVTGIIDVLKDVTPFVNEERGRRLTLVEECRRRWLRGAANSLHSVDYNGKYEETDENREETE